MIRQFALSKQGGDLWNFVHYQLEAIINSGWLLKDRVPGTKDQCVFVFECHDDSVPDPRHL